MAAEPTRHIWQGHVAARAEKAKAAGFGVTGVSDRIRRSACSDLDLFEGNQADLTAEGSWLGLPPWACDCHYA